MTRTIYEKFRHFLGGHYNLLLIFLFLIFAFRPQDRFDVSVGIWKFIFVGMVVFSTFNIDRSPIVRITVSLLAIPAVLFNWIDLLQETKLMIILITVSTWVFLAVCAASILRDVVLRARVSLETLRGAICAYFLLAFCFAYFYLFLEVVIPGTFAVRDKIIPVIPHAFYFFSQMLYFSFTSLFSAGYGDIVAVKDVGQTACVIEMTIGHLYIAILIARLVSIYSLAAEKKFFLKMIREKNHSTNE